MDKRAVGLNTTLLGIVLSILATAVFGLAIAVASDNETRDNMLLAKMIAVDGIDSIYATYPEAEVILDLADFPGKKARIREGYVEVIGSDAVFQEERAPSAYPYTQNRLYDDIDAFMTQTRMYKTGKKILFHEPGTECPTFETREEKIFIQDTGFESIGGHLRGLLHGEGIDGGLTEHDLLIILEPSESISISIGGSTPFEKRKAQKLSCLIKEEIKKRSSKDVTHADDLETCSTTCIQINMPAQREIADMIYKAITEYLK